MNLWPPDKNRRSTTAFNYENSTHLNLVPRVLLGTKVPWWIAVTCQEHRGQEHRNNTIINCFIAQNLGNKEKPRDHDPPGYFRSKKYPGNEVVLTYVLTVFSVDSLKALYVYSLFMHNV